jgi:hypothetical protein
MDDEKVIQAEVPANPITVKVSTPPAATVVANIPPATPSKPVPTVQTHPVATKTPTEHATPKEISPMPKGKKKKAVVKAKRAYKKAAKVTAAKPMAKTTAKPVLRPAAKTRRLGKGAARRHLKTGEITLRPRGRRNPEWENGYIDANGAFHAEYAPKAVVKVAKKRGRPAMRAATEKIAAPIRKLGLAGGLVEIERIVADEVARRLKKAKAAAIAAFERVLGG